MEHTTRAKRIKKTATSGWTFEKHDKEMFEEILLQEAMPVGNGREKVAQVLEKIQKADFDPWGGACKAVMVSIKSKRSPAITNHDLLRDIIITLFPQVSSEPNLRTAQIDPGEIPGVTTEEVLEAAKGSERAIRVASV